MRLSAASLAAGGPEADPRLLAADYPAWIANPFRPATDDEVAGEIRFR
jgi:hypothetical protein